VGMAKEGDGEGGISMGFANETRRSRPRPQGVPVALPVTLPLTLPAPLSDGVGKPWLSRMPGFGVPRGVEVAAMAVAAARKTNSVPGTSSFRSPSSSRRLVRARILARVVRSVASVSAALLVPISSVSMPRALRSLEPIGFPFHACCAACTAAAAPSGVLFSGQTDLDLRPITFLWSGRGTCPFVFVTRPDAVDAIDARVEGPVRGAGRSRALLRVVPVVDDASGVCGRVSGTAMGLGVERVLMMVEDAVE
jgi:hypothetical protein